MRVPSSGSGLDWPLTRLEHWRTGALGSGDGRLGYMEHGRHRLAADTPREGRSRTECSGEPCVPAVGAPSAPNWIWKSREQRPADQVPSACVCLLSVFGTEPQKERATNGQKQQGRCRRATLGWAAWVAWYLWPRRFGRSLRACSLSVLARTPTIHHYQMFPAQSRPGHMTLPHAVRRAAPS